MMATFKVGEFHNLDKMATFNLANSLFANLIQSSTFADLH